MHNRTASTPPRSVTPKPSNQTSHPRHAWLAALLSLLLPGLGQLYNGAINKAAWFYLLFAAFSTVVLSLTALYLPLQWVIDGLVLVIITIAAIWLLSIIEAARDARHKADYQVMRWQGFGSYSVVFVIGSLLLMPAITQHIRTHYIESFRVPSNSMEPNVIAGDMLFADKRYNCPGCQGKVERGDVVIFFYPQDRTQYYIKRVIGLPGDRIRIDGYNVMVNQQTLAVSRQQKQDQRQDIWVVAERATSPTSSKEWITVWRQNNKNLPNVDLTVPAGEIFVLGDNRANSNDSRFFGTIPLSDVIAEARQIWLSYNRQLGGLQWQRTGKIIH